MPAFDPDNPLCLDPDTGQVLALNHGAATGVHRGPVPGTVVPVNLTPPSWSTAPDKVGAIGVIDIGVWAPTDTNVRVDVGTGTTVETFVGILVPTDDGTTERRFTATEAMVGLALTAKVIGIADVAGPAIFIASGVTVEDEVETPGFPAGIAAGDWNVTEVRDGTANGVVGLREIEVDAGVTWDTGDYSLLWYSGDSGGLPTITNPTGPLTAGVTYRKDNGLPIGSINYNSLAWWRLSDNAIQRAHGPNPDTATDQQKVVTIQGLDTPTNPPGDDPTFDPDVTVGDIFAVRAQIASWIANWNGTVPSGKTASDDRVIGINVTSSGTFDLRNLVNAQATAQGRRIFIRHVGTYSNTGCSVRHNGALRLDGSRGIWCALMDVRTGMNAGITAASSNLCGLLCSWLQASASTFAFPTGMGSVVSLVSSALNFTIGHCYIRGSQTSAVLLADVSGLNYYGNVLDYTSTDDHKVHGGVQNIRFERNWMSRRHLDWDHVGSRPHYDFKQNQGEYELNNRYYGNVAMTGETESGVVNQIFFHKREQNPDTRLRFTGTTFEQNIGMTGLGLVPNGGGSKAAWAGARYNTCVTLWDPGLANGCIIAGHGPRDFNYCAAFGGNDLNADGEAGDTAGPNGLPRPGGPNRQKIDTNGDGKPDDIIRDYSDIAGDFRYGIPWQNAAGTLKPVAQQTLKAFEPAAGSRLHWLHANPVGAYLRAREIYDPSYRTTASAAAGYNVMPHKWPALHPWRTAYNSDGYVTDGYTGSYDSNGDPA